MSTETPPLFQFTHLAVVVRDLEKALEQYEALGMGPFKRFSLPSPEYSFAKREQLGGGTEEVRYECAYGRMGAIGLEVQLMAMTGVVRPRAA